MFTSVKVSAHRQHAHGVMKDGGFTLVELLVGIGIFAILMAMVSAFMAVGLQSLRTASTANALQAQQQLAVIEISKQIKFIDNPIEQGSPPPAILKATSDEMIFFTLSGSGVVDRLAYKVMICESSNGVELITVPPELVNGAAVVNAEPNLDLPEAECASDGFDPTQAFPNATRRLLVANDRNNDPKVQFTYFNAQNDEIFPYITGVDDTRDASEIERTMSSISKVTVRLADPSVGSPTEQSVVLANER